MMMSPTLMPMRNSMRFSSDAERALPDARGIVAGRPERK
jgi:hypothetical protein